jgi:hypothetical protein
MKVIFLDLDGVLNGDEFLDQDRMSDKDGDWVQWWTDWIDPVAVEHLNSITDRTEAKLVFSSNRRTWLSLQDIAHIFSTVGITGELIDKTPYLRGEDRGTEIRQWLVDTKLEVESFVVLDDHDDVGDLSDRLVRVDSVTGLTSRDVDQTIELFRD